MHKFMEIKLTNTFFLFGKRLLMIIMKTYIFLCCTTIFALSPVNLISQNSKVKIEEDKTLTVDQVFDIIMNQTDYKFFYEEGLFKDLPKIKVKKGVENTNKLLNRSLSNGHFSVVITDNNAVIVKEKSPDTPKEIQQLSISGKVVDETGMPLPGASILKKGTTNATTTDFEGKFSIKAIKGDVLLISFIGYVQKEVLVDSQKDITVSLKPEVSSLNEIVVIGYGTQKKENVSGAVSQIKTKDIPKAANSSINQLLAGRAAGLQARQTSSEPGGNIDISIRGRGNPLIIIDGIQMPTTGLEASNSNIANELNNVRRGGFAGLSPEDIESIEVLKDASASIYGVNAGDGVILITTKKGKEGQMRINYNGSTSVVNNMKYLKTLSSSEYMKTYNMFSKDKFLFDNAMTPYGTKTPDLAAYNGAYSPFSEQDIQNPEFNTNWLDKVLKVGSIANHSLSINGGSGKLVYYASGSYFNQQGNVVNSSMERFTGKANLSFKINKFLTLNTNFNASKAEFGNTQSGWSTGGAGAQSFAGVQAAVAYPANLPVYNTNGEFSRFANIGNPVSLLDIKDKTNFTSFLTNLSLDIAIIPDVLTGKLIYGNTAETSTRDFFVPKSTFYFEQNTARGSFNEAKRQWQTYEATLALKKSILNDNVVVDAVFGLGEYPKESYGFGAAGAGMLDAINTANLGSATTQTTISSYKEKSKTRSYFARSSFEVLNKYVLQLGIRHDGYSGFFPQNKFASFPSASFAWKASKESFLQNIECIDLLKFRGSIGVTGAIPSTFVGSAYAAYIPDSYAIRFNDGSVSYIPYTLSNIDRPELNWPKTIMKNIGMDLTLFKNRVSLSVDLFRDDVTRLITYASTDPLGFLATQPINGAHQVRKGWDITLDTKNYKSDKFKWSTTLNLSHVDFRWKDRFPNYVQSTYQGIPYDGINDPVNSIYAFKTNGILQIGQAVPAYQPAKASYPGSPIFVDSNNDGVIDGKDIVRFNASPDINIGLGNTFNYGDFDLSVFFYGQFGAYGNNQLLSWTNPLRIVTKDQAGIREINQVWSASNPDGKYPGVSYNESSLALPVGTDVRIQKRDFVRCRNITLGYNFNSKVLKNYIKDLRFYVDVQNPFVFTKFEIGDPEVDSQGNSAGLAAPYPMVRTCSLGINVNF
ncbi:SusC/RagA family TonB-linked outer membrane protein [Flavobacterium sufflavum]|uniref:SusC/RagA family TonB-linked outer membrane protein n=2 Tax=Flavobacterium sufflavum TaxID=1921138 RepID=A0A437L2U0_9FLAO|nr:SusC/RagA family TonB-linked outer membrane protein [Flavobacterium sufflavum]